ncbi:hypothetical protein BHS09_31210 [Myxococcus xanthus]|uniref:Uncharacterized protein n=1 Tax=Myxococcus xanthus TaxID=34 RepID=A0AAE6G534_MYXXA|nr:hypothetical protein [Myxococcus xanthus]QDE71088.1 hypothetical protein BHS09_31210 [Myxococcus xanthus]QDE78368.1 hypothetical protein BHS08_31230 [Myxococcus xanthus]QDF07659.1 hypothetical protein BHS04_31325 [Myxococcus xanthus]
MNLIEPCVLAGAVVGTLTGAILGFPHGLLWGLGGMAAGFVGGVLVLPFVILFLVMAGMALFFWPRHLLRQLRGTRPGTDDAPREHGDH